MADKKTFQLTISDVGIPRFSEEAYAVSVPGVEGEMQLLAGHEPLISPLKAGEIVVERADGETERFAIEKGTLETSDNQVTIIM